MLVGAIGEELREVEKVDRIVTMWGSYIHEELRVREYG